jgi:hypothetical protein
VTIATFTVFGAAGGASGGAAGASGGAAAGASGGAAGFPGKQPLNIGITTPNAVTKAITINSFCHFLFFIFTSNLLSEIKVLFR